MEIISTEKIDSIEGAKRMDDEHRHQPIGSDRKYTSKQMGDACEMLVAAELTLAGIPALKVPDNWPHYDVIAQPLGQPPQRISVKSRTFKRGAAFVSYNSYDLFDWLAIVILKPETRERFIYIIPRALADENARRYSPTSKVAHQLEFRIDEVERLFAKHEGNYELHSNGRTQAEPLNKRSE